jgi:lipopolysaccharide transport system ATP-binding protein
LKVLSRITKPTTGRVEISGRVGSLLEVGTGFHPELSGRENVYLNGSILGMSRTEVARKFDEIVAFAEVEKFLDTPVKRYSSGMYVRLAFAVAAHLEPEILIIDEVLAVGDAAFQAKCLGKMQQVGRSGRTVLFVSHNIAALAALTTRCVLLQGGRVATVGNTRQVIDRYLEVGGGTQPLWRRGEGAGGAAVIRQIRALNAAGEPAGRFPADEPFTLEFTCEFAEPVQAQLAFRLNADRDCATVFTTALDDPTGRDRRFPAGPYTARCTVPAHLVRPGHYHLLAALNNFRGPQFDLVERALSFEVTDIGSLTRLDDRIGAVAPLLAWEAADPREANPTC